MMARWLRYYVATLTQTKIQSLPAKLFRHWVNLLCIAGRADDNGRLPDIETVAFDLRCSAGTATKVLKQLVARALIDIEEGRYHMHDWGTWQYHSDSSTERVKQFRERHQKPPRNVSATPPDTDTDTDTDKTPTPTPSPEGADAFNLTEPELSNADNGKDWKTAKFEEFWGCVWWKVGLGRAEEAFRKQAKTVQISDRIIAAAVAQGPELIREAETNKRSAVHPSTWLNGKRYLDERTQLKPESDPDWAQ